MKTFMRSFYETSDWEGAFFKNFPSSLGFFVLFTRQMGFRCTVTHSGVPSVRHQAYVNVVFISFRTGRKMNRSSRDVTAVQVALFEDAVIAFFLPSLYRNKMNIIKSSPSKNIAFRNA